MEGLGNAYCHRDVALEVQKAACASPLTVTEKTLCMQAQTAFMEADGCTDKQLSDAEICSRTCSWVSAAQSARMKILKTMDFWICVTEVGILTVAIVRLCNTMVRTAMLMRDSSKRYGWRKSWLLQFGLCELAYSDIK